MSEIRRNQKSGLQLCTTLIDSSKIFFSDPQIYISIFTLTTLPLSFLLVSLSLSSSPIHSQITHLHATARFSSTRFEARHVWRESRENAVNLLFHKLLLFIPSYLLSLLAVITSVDSASLSHQNKRPSFQTAYNAVKSTWRRPLVTSICIYAVTLTYAGALRACLAVAADSDFPRFYIAAVGAIVEVYLFAVTSLALVVSANEEVFGFEAIRVGSRLMRGRRFDGWVLSCVCVLMSGAIGLELDGRDLLGISYWWNTSTVVIGFGEKMGLIFLLGVIMLWSLVVTTVFYCECKKRHVVIGKSEIELCEDEKV